MHEYELLVNVALCLFAGLTCGFVTQRLGLSPILGYLVAGILVGPHTPGLVADAKIASQLAEIGVILLMFGVGLHFDLKDLLAVRGIAVPGAVGQSLVATALGTVIAVAFGWGVAAGLVLGMAVSVASTVVLTRVLLDNGALNTREGHAAVGWLIVEDIFTVVVLVLLPALGAVAGASGGDSRGLAASVGVALLKLAVLVFLVLVLGARVVPALLTFVARSRSRELFTLTVLVLALGIAVGSSVFFGASMALGAFLAGMVVGQSPVSQQAAADALPLRDAFAVLFFVSVGMLFVPGFVVSNPLLVIAVLGVVLVAKPLGALVIVSLLGHSLRTGLTVAVGLAQIGEFSFILGDLARKHGLLPQEGETVLVACALLSISANPVLFRMVGPMERWIARRPRLRALLDRRTARPIEHEAPPAGDSVRAIVVGFGPTGRTLARVLLDFGIEPAVIDLNVDTISALRHGGRRSVYGDATKREILEAAGIAGAKYLLITLPDAEAAAQVVAMARTLNEEIVVFARARYLSDRRTLERAGASAVSFEEAQVAVGLAALLLEAEGAGEEKIRAEARRIRTALQEGDAA